MSFARNPTVKARDATPGTKVLLKSASFSRVAVDREVLSNVRAADTIEVHRAKIARLKSKPVLMDAARDLLAALEAVEFEGREARLIEFKDEGRPRRYNANDELRLA